jgi:hypothetical protein
VIHDPQEIGATSGAADFQPINGAFLNCLGMALFIPGSRAGSEFDRSRFDESASLPGGTGVPFWRDKPSQSSTWLSLKKEFVFWYTLMICASGYPFCRRAGGSRTHVTTVRTQALLPSWE